MKQRALRQAHSIASYEVYDKLHTRIAQDEQAIHEMIESLSANDVEQLLAEMTTSSNPARWTYEEILEREG